jgi:hypothetical protein
MSSPIRRPRRHMRSSFRRAHFPLLRAPMLLALGLLALAWVSGCGSKDDDGNQVIHQPEDYLPTSISGWELAEANRTGSNYDDLYAAIDGGAEIYVRHNLRSFAYAKFSGTGDLSGATLEVLITEMQTPADTQSLYEDSDLIQDPHEDVPDLGDDARLSMGLAGGMLQFIRDKYYVEIEVTDATPQKARTQLEFIGPNIDGEMAQ